MDEGGGNGGVQGDERRTHSTVMQISDPTFDLAA